LFYTKIERGARKGRKEVHRALGSEYCILLRFSTETLEIHLQLCGSREARWPIVPRGFQEEANLFF
jgi:hypothetical protein